MLEVSHVSKRYGKTLANQDICFTLPDRSISLLVGPNGAGKSTIIKCIMGLLTYEGEITIDGTLNKTEAGRGAISYVPEIPHLYPLLTVDEHMEFVARIYKLQEWQTESDALLKRFDLADKRDKMGSELSKGMQQKLSICTALLTKPKFIIFDEPMIGLDPHAIKVLKQTFAELKAQGTSLLISTHILDTVDELWDQVCIMVNGQIVAIASHEQLDEHNDNLENLFFRVTEPYDFSSEDIRKTGLAAADLADSPSGLTEAGAEEDRS